MSRVLFGLAHLLVYICFAVAGVYAWRIVAQTVRVQVNAMNGTQSCNRAPADEPSAYLLKRCGHDDSTTHSEPWH